MMLSKRFTPLLIEIMLHYYTRTTDYGCIEGNANAPAVVEAIDFLVNNGMLEGNTETFSEKRYDITIKGSKYIDFLRDVPMPVQQWVMP